MVGMAVMGSNLARNLAHHGYTVAICNRMLAKTCRCWRSTAEGIQDVAARPPRSPCSRSPIRARSS